jgi:hypothetical protein
MEFSNKTWPGNYEVAMPHKDPEEGKAYQKDYHAKNRDARNAKRRKYHAENADRENLRSKTYAKNNREKVKSINKADYIKKRDTFNGRAAILWRTARDRAKARSELFSLTLEYVKRGMSAPCPRTGVIFDLNVKNGRSNPFSPSIDRIKAGEPYSNDNVQIVCWAYNRMKSDMSDEDLLTFCKFVVRQAEIVK